MFHNLLKASTVTIEKRALWWTDKPSRNLRRLSKTILKNDKEKQIQM